MSRRPEQMDTYLPNLESFIWDHQSLTLDCVEFFFYLWNCLLFCSLDSPISLTREINKMLIRLNQIIKSRSYWIIIKWIDIVVGPGLHYYQIGTRFLITMAPTNTMSKISYNREVKVNIWFDLKAVFCRPLTPIILLVSKYVHRHCCLVCTAAITRKYIIVIQKFPVKF